MFEADFMMRQIYFSARRFRANSGRFCVPSGPLSALRLRHQERPNNDLTHSPDGSVEQGR
jgi:hypothetical protein